MNNIKILYVEDDKSVIAFVKVLFKKFDITNVTFALNGLEALTLYEINKYDLVITDILMPEMDGFTLIENIKKINTEQLFMMITGLENRDDLIRAIELRVNYFIEKPILPAKFSKVIDDCFNDIKQKKELELSNLLLKQYKHAVDESTIVSKSDLKGKIIYANEAFYKISQLSEAECLGKNHNIVRHPDMNPEVFQDMWNTLKLKKEWRGVLKNRAKDGSEYIVNALIIPLLDANNEIIEYLGIKHDITALEHYKNDLQSQLEIAVKDIVDTQKEVVFTMGAIGETRSKETGNHVKRVAEYSYLLAKLVGLDEKSAQLLKLASPMHDIGKVGIPDAILNKPGKLTYDEFEIMKTHSTLGYEMLKGSKRDILQTSAIVAHEHHERWDGTGYPRGLKKANIHIYGRITSICDVFDALGSHRCYKKAWLLDDILAFFKEGSGTQFDPILIKLFFKNLSQFLEIRDKYADS